MTTSTMPTAATVAPAPRRATAPTPARYGSAARYGTTGLLDGPTGGGTCLQAGAWAGLRGLAGTAVAPVAARLRADLAPAVGATPAVAAPVTAALPAIAMPAVHVQRTERFALDALPGPLTWSPPV